MKRYLDFAARAVDLPTIVLLFAMMILNVNLRLAGFYQLVSWWVVALARSAPNSAIARL